MFRKFHLLAISAILLFAGCKKDEAAAPADEPTPPVTFEELIAIAQKLTSKDVQGFAYNLNEPFWGAGFYGAFGGWPDAGVW